jgi:hypothetical protein
MRTCQLLKPNQPESSQSKKMVSDHLPDSKIFRVLSLDGGGAKGFYTLGALKEIEALADCPLYEKFDLIYGTSTGAIIAALLGLSRLSSEDRAMYDAATTGSVTYSYTDFKRDATAYIIRPYNNVNTQKKALYIPGGNSGRRNADILIASRFRRYHEFKSWQNQRFDEGIFDRHNFRTRPAEWGHCA